MTSTTEFARKYGPWALVAGASDGVGATFAESLAARGVDVVLIARRAEVLNDVASGIAERHGVGTRVLALDLAQPQAAAQILEGVADLEIGMLVYCAGADPNFAPFLSNSIETAESMVQRNCVVPMQLCHQLAQPMVARGRGGIVIFGSGAGLAGGPNMVAYGASKAFDMVFAESLWAELHGEGVDVLGVILGKTNTPALRRLEHSRGQLSSEDAVPEGAAAVEDVVAEAIENLGNGPTLMAGEQMRAAAGFLGSLSRNEAVALISAASAGAMGAS
ncbi:SDR family NAD(P)-dependent oxidoreductase [Aldersonia kunmingensis]|uniref:SDR family NAD(P)-dependent oxidoreductase n=1 Tax=Aldersonia kunmingensis TaxID=408066 RepID=UPI0008306833|nr:SDR family NAD(P)-dependent oxidoreductase [Aldersonia kunmingensis]